jgi:diguanylate cyclase (GGDEF)-like protein
MVGKMQSKQTDKNSQLKSSRSSSISATTLIILTSTVLCACIALIFVIGKKGGLIASIAALVLAALMSNIWAWRFRRFKSEISTILDDPESLPVHPNRKKTSLFQKLKAALLFLNDKAEYQQRKSTELKKELDFLRKELAYTRSLLDQVSYFDLSSGVVNRSHLKRELNKEIIRSAREGLPLALVLIEFINYRECFHAVSEKVAKEYFSSIANMIMRTVRVSDLVFLYEDDTFALVLPATGRKTAQMVINRIRSSIMSQKLPSSNNRPPKPKLAYGISTNLVKEPSAEKLLAMAQKPLTKTKHRATPVAVK